MAIRVQSQEDVNFGNNNSVSAVTVTAVRIQDADDTTPVIRRLPTPITVGVGAPMRIPSGLLDLIYVAGHMGNHHMLEALTSYWGITGLSLNTGGIGSGGSGTRVMEIDLMTGASGAEAVVTASGYSQQRYGHSGNRWSICGELD